MLVATKTAYCIQYVHVMSSSQGNELSADSVPDEDTFTTCMMRRLDERDKEEVKFPLHLWLQWLQRIQQM